MKNRSKQMDLDITHLFSNFSNFCKQRICKTFIFDAQSWHLNISRAFSQIFLNAYMWVTFKFSRTNLHISKGKKTPIIMLINPILPDYWDSQMQPREVFYKKSFFKKNSPYSQKNSCIGVSFLMNLQTYDLQSH